jgi:hypothetical protein
MSVGEVGLSYDLNARSHAGDFLQAQYFQQVLAAEHDELATRLDTHAARFSHAELAHDAWRMQYERREMQALSSEARKLAAMLEALQRRFQGVVGG